MDIRKDYLPFGRPDFSEEEIAAVARVMRTGWIGQGKETATFEEELAAYIGAAHVVSVNSCTSALFLSLLALGLGPDDEVIVPSFTWCSTANAALYLGAKPVFCEVDPHTMCVTPSTVAAKVTSRTRAVVLVHMGGLAIDVSAIRRALPDRVMLIEDAAHALGARDARGRQVGSSGNLVSFSFYANKNLSTGEGGAIALQDRETAARLRSLRLHGLPADAWMRFTNPNVLPSADIEILGYKMNFTDLQSAIGRVQLSRYAAMQARRHAIARRYVANLSEVAGLQFQEGVLSDDHARHLLLVLLPADASARALTRDQVVLGLRAANIGATVHYHPLHKMPLYAAYRTESLPVTENLASRILTLPISATMSEADVDYVSGHLRRLLRKES